MCACASIHALYYSPSAFVIFHLMQWLCVVIAVSLNYFNNSCAKWLFFLFWNAKRIASQHFSLSPHVEYILKIPFRHKHELRIEFFRCVIFYAFINHQLDKLLFVFLKNLYICCTQYSRFFLFSLRFHKLNGKSNISFSIQFDVSLDQWIHFGQTIGKSFKGEINRTKNCVLLINYRYSTAYTHRLRTHLLAFFICNDKRTIHYKIWFSFRFIHFPSPYATFIYCHYSYENEGGV